MHVVIDLSTAMALMFSSKSVAHKVMACLA
jgi:hypothetical protein